MASLKLHYLFDPLCGWCYASAPALERLAHEFPQALQLCPTGLFSGDGARAITPAFAMHARSNDQRIASLTGQLFSPGYFQRILGGANMRFDSMAMSRALTAVREIDATLEPVLFHRLQTERYVEGLDTSSPDIVARISVDLLRNEGHELSESEFATRLQHGKNLAKQTRQRIEDAQFLMDQAGASGVPLLLVEIDDSVHSFSGADLYAAPGDLIAKIEQIASTTA
ncbi:putative DSBA-like thioredoxin protein [Pseudomonas cichorii]|uniref:Putative DSBA-like thioredoxin protein n=1 Tax=Pseudomonas cichorii TaxID=36746 RepID=A0A3M4M8X2_PSECI|nr:hypothetical protein [Pseudomonas cichorii]RMQ50262.1 putative DSBA-like thioredoxin protein [Pseudomonas cichorii]